MVTADEARRELARRELARRRGQASQGAAEQPSAAGDAFSSFAAGVGRGAADLVGLPGTLGDLTRSGLQWGLQQGYGLATGEAPDPRSESGVERFFAGPSPEVEQSVLGGGSSPLGGENLRAGLSILTSGATDYQPQTTAGEYARTIGEFLPGAMTLGGGGVANALRYGVVPAVASEGAGQLTEDTALEPYARVAGALVGGAIGSRAGAPKVSKPPSAAEIRQSAGYNQLDDAMRNARLTGNAYRDVVRDVWKEAQDFGLTTDLKSRFGGTLRDFLQRAESSGGASLHDLELLRRSLRNAAGNTLDKSSQALSAKLVDKLDDAVDALSASQIAASGASGRPVVDALKDAREAYRTGMKAQLVEDAVQRAQQAASGVENGLRVEFRKLVNNPRSARNFSSAEREAIKKVAKGDFTSNALRFLGTFGFPIDQGRNWLGALAGSSAAGSMAGSVFGPGIGTAVGAGVALGGTAARHGASRATQGLADIAEALVKAGPQGQAAFSAGQAARQVAGREAVLQALLQSQSAAQVPYAREYAQ